MSGDPLALLATVMLPVTAPVAVGANFTARVAVCEAASVAGEVTPLTLKPAPAAVMLVICTVAVPVLVSVIFCEVLLPVDTVPKLRLVGFATNCPVAVVDPVPLRVTFVVGLLGSSLVIAMFPLALPADIDRHRHGLACADCPWSGYSTDPEFCPAHRDHGNRQIG